MTRIKPTHNFLEVSKYSFTRWNLVRAKKMIKNTYNIEYTQSQWKLYINEFDSNHTSDSKKRKGKHIKLEHV